MLFFANMFSQKTLNEAKKFAKNGVIQYAPHIFQTNLIEGMKSYGANISIISTPPIGSYPLRYKKLLIANDKWEDDNTQVGYVNLPIIKYLLQSLLIYSIAKKKLKEGKHTKLLIYSMHFPYLQAANWLKKDFPDLKVFLIQTDAIPGRNDMNHLMRRRHIYLGNLLVRMAKVCDGFILLTKYLKDPIEIGDRPSLIMECICNNRQVPNKKTDGTNRICLYTGSLNREHGICDLVDAFKKIPDAQLWICGRGNSEDHIEAACKEFSNIKYYGFVDHDEIQVIRDRCDYLINPRRPKGTYTLYSFPSKTAEYMVSGKPVIMYKLEGIPDEYDDYLNYLTGQSSDTIAQELKNIFSQNYSQLVTKAYCGRAFMLKNKSKEFQAKRIIEFMNEEI